VTEPLEKLRMRDRHAGDTEALEKAFLVARGDMLGFAGLQVVGFDVDVAAYFQLKQPVGALVVKVVPLSPAERAGLQRLDVVTRVGDKEIEDAFQCRRVIRGLTPGQTVKMEILRLRQGRRTVEVKVENFKDWVGRIEDPEKLALRMRVLERRLRVLERMLRHLRIQDRLKHGGPAEDEEEAAEADKPGNTKRSAVEELLKEW
jgi:hypothetical protein